MNVRDPRVEALAREHGQNLLRVAYLLTGGRPALDTLSADERAVIVLRYYADLPDAEIADILGCARATVRSHAHRAFATLRRGALAHLLKEDT